jgi:hypothetical protein
MERDKAIQSRSARSSATRARQDQMQDALSAAIGGGKSWDEIRAKLLTSKRRLFDHLEARDDDAEGDGSASPRRS